MPPIPDYPDDMPPTGGASLDISPWWLILGIVAFLVFAHYWQKNFDARMARERAEEAAELERERDEYGTDEADEDGDDWEGDTTLTPEQIRHWRNLLAGTGADSDAADLDIPFDDEELDPDPEIPNWIDLDEDEERAIWGATDERALWDEADERALRALRRALDEDDGDV